MAGSNWLMGSQFTLPLLIHVCTSNWISMGYTYKQTTKTSTDFLPLKNTTYFFAIYDLSKYSIITFYYLITFFSIDIVLLFFSTIQKLEVSMLGTETDKEDPWKLDNAVIMLDYIDVIEVYT